MGDQAASAESQSIEDRIASKFGADEAEPQEAESEQPETEEASEEKAEETAQPEFSEVEFEGKTYQVPPELKEAIIRHADYTRKTQEVADQRRQVELQAQQARLWNQERQFSESIQEDVARLAQLDVYLKQYDALDWRSMSTEELMRNRLDVDRLEKQKAELNQALDGKRQKWLEGQQQQIEQYRSQAQEFLGKTIPGWGDSTAKEVAQHALTDGYSAEEISSILDPRHARTLWKAMQYDKLQAATKGAVQKAKEAPRIVKPGPGSRPMPAQVRKDLDLRKAQKNAKTSSERARIIEQRLAEKF